MVGETSTSQDEPWFSAPVCFRVVSTAEFSLGCDSSEELELLLWLLLGQFAWESTCTDRLLPHHPSQPEPTFFLF